MNQSPLYVGYVLKRYPRFSETFVVNEILAHERAGIRVDIFALGPVAETHFQDCISQVRSPVTRLADKQHDSESLWELMEEGHAKLADFSARIALARDVSVHEFAQALRLALAVKTRGIGHLHAHFGTHATTIARLAAAFSDVGYTFTAHAKDIYFAYEKSVGLGRKLRDAAQTITVSDYNLAYLTEKYGDDARNIVRLYNGLDLSRFTYTPPLNRGRQILAVGRLVAKKGFDVLIDALSLLDKRGEDFHCRLIGGGPLLDPLRTRINAAGLARRVTLEGALPQAEIIAAMRQAAVVAAPCVISHDGDRDGLPTVLLEAMALGTPVISTRVAGIPELVIDGETGLCVAPRDPAALADAIAALLAAPDIQRRLSRQARALIERDYDIDANSGVLRDIFRRAVNAGPGRYTGGGE
ncbi:MULTISPECIES: glycosyltransferase [Brenneria]|uniref:Colanic acid biosynthesis glycosyltransferase WcaL n=1 Tax=Brenneria nigrifluens DSM 30175 = ATCC 13028 TaxID=1121120 RepID=A0A2U1UR25_9GAMM|nr:MULTISPECIES: glycosyltransferase [Brenneria]EHD22210.1 glycosyl transferase group 1 [Brenneria sp. EniD312]PWC24042.1 colanic acid biosynthesis glycosyltransferase WcaL [Brenneria nigrifluens DSM 30175 = ATCC 13028]QCR05235.1 colanic acid biosynthesis glycosyltransferase WcaL [Brenneria nigrifluens DSM 30175 = ATCC 13028]